jgi:acyl carrier protein
MEEKIKELMAIVFEINVGDISSESASNNTKNWDSLHHMNLIISLEEEFSIEFEDEEIVEMMSFKNIVDLISKKIK